MNNYYIDPSATDNGTGTIDSPFNSWAVLGTLQPSFPFTINVKRGTSERGNFSYPLLNNLVSTSDEQSFIQPYGTGSNPVIIQGDGTVSALQLVLRKTTVLMIDVITNEVSQSADLVALSALTTLTDPSVNVYASYCNFKSFPYTMISQYCKGLAVVANRGVNAAANEMGCLNCTFDYLSRGVQVLGNYNVPSDQDPTTNVGDRYRSNGGVVDQCSFTNMRDDGAILNRCTSPDSANYDTSNSLVSKISNCYYSSYRANTAAADNFTQAPSVAFWTVYSNRTVIEYCTAIGSYASRADRMAFDFDIMTWDCVVRYCYSANNAGGILLFISNADGDGSQAQPSGTSNTEWFINRRWGQGNNVMHDCVSFNDGISRAASASGLWMSKFRYFGYASNCSVKNLTIIDTLSANRATIMHQYGKFTASDNVTSINIQDTIFHYRRLAVAPAIIRGDTTTDTQGLVKFKSNNMYSEAATGLFSIPTYADAGGNTSTNPQFEFIPQNAPSTFDSAKLIKMMKTSAYYGILGNLVN